MNLENIKKGTIGKNYRDMCRILEEPILEGNSKKAQLKEWKRKFDWDKQGNKFIIKEIYDTPLPEDFSENDIYTKYVNTILLKYLKEKGSGEFTMTQLLRICGFVNDNWNNFNLLKLCFKDENITFAQAKYYYNQLYCHVHTYCTTAITRCLNRLQKRDFLFWGKQLWIEVDNEFRVATKKETEDYLNLVNRIREELEIIHLNVYNMDKYYNAINNRILDFGWKKAIQLITIVYATDYIDKQISKAEEEYREALLGVNEHCLEQMYKYIDVDIENDIKKLSNKLNTDIEIARLCVDVDTIKENKATITDMYININNEKIFDN